jgi:hypothetical protein
MVSTSERTRIPIDTQNKPSTGTGLGPKGHGTGLAEVVPTSDTPMMPGGKCGPTATPNVGQERGNPSRPLHRSVEHVEKVPTAWTNGGGIVSEAKAGSNVPDMLTETRFSGG